MSRPPTGSSTGAGWAAASRVGASALLSELLSPLERTDSPFDDEVPRVDSVGTHWVEPVLVVDVDTHHTSRNQRLRQPSYRGLRTDLTPDDLS